MKCNNSGGEGLYVHIDYQPSRLAQIYIRHQQLGGDCYIHLQVYSCSTGYTYCRISRAAVLNAMAAGICT
jgi:hypothetical protein